MRAGKLRNRLLIEQMTSTGDDFGGSVPTWSTVATVWASVEDLSGKEFLNAQAVQAEVTTRLRIRYRSGIKPDMRATVGSRVFDIWAVLEPEGGRDRELHLMARELVT